MPRNPQYFSDKANELSHVIERLEERSHKLDLLAPDIAKLLIAHRSEKARADNLQKQLDEIATMKMRGRFGFDPFDHGRPLI
jgi:hypothetical protein